MDPRILALQDRIAAEAAAVGRLAERARVLERRVAELEAIVRAHAAKRSVYAGVAPIDA